MLAAQYPTHAAEIAPAILPDSLFAQVPGDVAFLEAVQVVESFRQSMRRRVIDAFRRIVEAVQRLDVRAGLFVRGAAVGGRYGLSKIRGAFRQRDQFVVELAESLRTKKITVSPQSKLQSKN